MNSDIYRECAIVRHTEESLLNLFSSGKMNGTIHTCVGQELSSYFIIKSLQKNDYIFSNHRCHGHYLHRFGDVPSLIGELMGKKNGVCSGIGSSQHIFREGFFSNGIQGGIVPLALGAALKFKKNIEKNISVVFIGDGTLGEGVVYETLNLASILKVPLLIVCEDNGFAQSTRKENAFSGDLKKRIEGFNIKYSYTSIWNEEDLKEKSCNVVREVRESSTPHFIHIETFRLNSHSKSDDNRDKNEIEEFRQIDPMVLYADANQNEAKKIDESLTKDISEAITKSENLKELTLKEYIVNHFDDFDKNIPKLKYSKFKAGDRVIDRINRFFHELMDSDKRVFFIGEDVLDPYGGAFKVSKGLSSIFPERVISTPISEQAITGMSNGLAISGMRPYLEIMFGDFMTLTFDQILNHASKFFYMYDKQINCPIVIRTPIGAGRGYGPTHSQAIEKFFLGIDNVRVVAINSYIDPYEVYMDVHRFKHPIIVFENKTGYGRKLLQYPSGYFDYEKEPGPFGNIQIQAKGDDSDVLIITYGETASKIVDVLESLFFNHDVVAEVHIITSLYPLNLDSVFTKLEKINKVIVFEESSVSFGFGSEVVSLIAERFHNMSILRVGAYDVPIPSIRNLEDSVLQTTNIVEKVKDFVNDYS